MKLLVLFVVIGVVCVVLFVVGLFSPAKSKRMQQSTDGFSEEMEKKGSDKAGRLGDMMHKAMKKSRHAADQSAEKGREIHHHIGRD